VTTAAAGKDDAIPQWAENAVMAMQENGIEVYIGENLTRGQVAVLLYRVSQMASEAPGLKMYQ
jgi:hypothetical protein